MNGYRVLTAALVLICLALGAFIAVSLQAPDQEPLPSAAPTKVIANNEPATPLPRLDPVKVYDVIADRPLFSPTPKPTRPPPLPRNDNNRPTLTGIVLTGIVIGPADKIALMSSSKSSKPLRLIEGEKLQGWKLEKVLADSVILSAGEETAEISVWDRRTAAARKPPGGR